MGALLRSDLGAFGRRAPRNRAVAVDESGVPTGFVGPDGTTVGGSKAIASAALAGLIALGRNPAFERAGPAFWEFTRTDLPAGLTSKASVGMLGTGEANLAYNLNYNDGTHRYNDPDDGAVWIALNGNGWFVQYAAAGLVGDDIWEVAGRKYSISGNLQGQVMIGQTDAQIQAGGYQACLTVPRIGANASIAGVSDLILEGAKTKGVSGHIYLNSYNSGDVYAVPGGGTFNIGGFAKNGKLNVNVPSGANLWAWYINDTVAAYMGLADVGDVPIAGMTGHDLGIRVQHAALHLSVDAGASACAKWDTSGNFIQKLNSSAPTLTVNSTLTVERTSNTQATLKMRGSDGVTRSCPLTFS